MSLINLDFSDPQSTVIPDDATLVSVVADGMGTYTITFQPLPTAADQNPPIIIIGTCTHPPHRPPVAP